MRALRQETKRLVLEVLTPAQRQQLDQMREEHAEERLSRRVERMTERLSLTDQQARQVRQIFERAHHQREAIRESERPEEQKRASMRQLRERTQAAIARVLTEEQQAQLDEMRERRGERGHGRRGRGRGHGRGNGNGNRGI